jgi:hypothetical protein
MVRREGTGSEDLFQRAAQQLRDAGIDFWTPYSTLAKSRCGLSDREMHQLGETVQIVLPVAKEALAGGDTSFVQRRWRACLRCSA